MGAGTGWYLVWGRQNDCSMVFNDLQISLQANKVPANKIIPFPTGKARDNSVPPPDSDRGHFENHHFQIRNVTSL